MSKKTYTRDEIAFVQLETAIWFFLNEASYASAITLAGAADNILHQLVLNSGQEPFLEYGRKVAAQLSGRIPGRSKYRKHVGDILGINPLKHMSDECPDGIEIDLPLCAEDTITKAIANYTQLHGERTDCVRAFLQWAWTNRNGQELLDQFKNNGGKLLSSARPRQSVDLKAHQRLDIAEEQLAIASVLFIARRDHISAITLAGAADVVLCRLVTNRGKENFTEHIRTQESDEKKSVTEVGREINDTLYINALKHMNPGDSPTISLDAEEAALGAILKAMANYVMLRGNKVCFVQDFLKWVRENLDPNKYNVECDPNWKSTELG